MLKEKTQNNPYLEDKVVFKGREILGINNNK